jgi:phage gp45-like
LRGLQNAEVTQGLAAGEQIVRPVEGQKQPLTDGQRIKAK